MPALPIETRDEIAAKIEAALSARLVIINASHQQIVSAIGTFDDELNIAEQEIITALPAGPSAWLLANQSIAREILVEVAKRRKDEL